MGNQHRKANVQVASKAALSNRAWMHRRKTWCVRVQAGTHGYLRQSGGKEELVILHYVNEQKIH